MGKEDLLSVGKPILFNTDMVRSILDGRKTVTRRVIKNFDIEENNGMITLYEKKEDDAFCISPIEDAKKVMLQYSRYQPGDILYVRETWRVNGLFSEDDEKFYIVFEYKADGSFTTVEVSEEIYEKYEYSMAENSPEWSPSIHMPKEAARIWLKVTDVRVERLQSMKLDDFLNEGVVIRPEAYNDPENAYGQAKQQFIAIWDRVIKRENIFKYGWAANQWVWVIEFERCEKPEPCILKGIAPAEDKRPCIGYQKSKEDDEPCEMCKGCRACNGEELE